MHILVLLWCIFTCKTIKLCHSLKLNVFQNVDYTDSSKYACIPSNYITVLLLPLSFLSPKLEWSWLASVTEQNGKLLVVLGYRPLTIHTPCLMWQATSKIQFIFSLFECFSVCVSLNSCIYGRQFQFNQLFLLLES